MLLYTSAGTPIHLGRDAIRLWNEYKNTGNQEALNTLLKYNKEDVINLSNLRIALDKLP